jgi:MFS family permease
LESRGLILTAFIQTTKPLMTLRQYLFGGTTKDDKPNLDPQGHGDDLHDDPAPEAINKQLPLRALLVRPVLIAAGSYATFSLVDISFRTIIPVFYAMPIDMGGLNLDPPAIGIILALFGISSGIIQWLFFVPMHDWLGAKTLFVASVSLCLPMIALFPAINAVARVYGLSYFVWFLVGLQMTLMIFASFAFGESARRKEMANLMIRVQLAITIMYIGAATPNKASLGATNGIAQTIVSVMRAVGPATVNSAYSLSIEEHILGGYFAYWVMVAMVGLTLWAGYLLPKKLWKE